MTLLGNANDDRATMAANLYLDTGTAFRYVMDGYAGRFSIEDGNMIWGTAGSGTLGAVATVSTKMTLLNNGNVGIGTDSPTARLMVKDSSDSGFDSGIAIIRSANSQTGYINMVGGAMNFNSPSIPIIFRQAGTERMRITSSGLTTIKRTGITGVAKNDMILQIGYEGNNGQNNLIGFGYNGGTNIPAYIGYTTTSGGGSTQGDLVFATRGVTTDIAPTERMRITSGGNVAIGGTLGADSQFRVELKPSTTILAGLRIGYANTSQNYYDANEHFFRNGIGSSSSLVFIDSNQNLLVGGTTLPAAASGAYVALRGGDNNCIETRRIGTGGRSHHIFYNGNGIVGNIETSGSTTSYNETSDYRLKENVVEMTGALDRVSQLKPSRFNFIADADKTVDGFLAHEVQEIVPHAISGEKDAVDEEGNPDYQGIDQSKLVPLLVGAIQELKADNDILKSRIETLENK